METADSTLLKEKHQQLDVLLRQMAADCWLVLCREGSDPSTMLYVGSPMVGESAFFFTKSGERIAVVANFDRLAVEEVGVFDEVLVYGLDGIEEPFRQVLARLHPRTIALNYSADDYLADGLTYGLYRRIRELAAVRDFEKRTVSSEAVLGPLRARKTPEEIRRLRVAIDTTQKIFDEIAQFARPGMTELEVGAFVHDRQLYYGTPGAFGGGAIVATGDVGVGHRDPGPYLLRAGDVLIVDMGVVYRGYSSDFTRTYYLCREGEHEPPAGFRQRFAAARDATHKAIAAIRPGMLGHEIDRIARDHIRSCGIEPYANELGHQIGRCVHDGGASLAPLTRRYGNSGLIPLEQGNVLTVEPFIYSRTTADGAPPIGLEEDVLVTETGASLLTNPQMELICISDS
jgi:Xaa-Pro aminopeptidase